MPYAVPDDLRGQLSPDPADPTGTPGELSDSVLAARITTASAQVDAALSSRYTVPFLDPAPALVREITVALACWLAALTYRKSVDIQPNDPLQLRYVWATGLLTQLSRGAADLPDITVSGTTTPAKQKGAVVVNRYTGAMFGLETFDLGQNPNPSRGPWRERWF